MRKLRCWAKIAAITGLIFLLTGCVSGSMPSLENVIINVGRSLPALWKLVTGAGYLFGFVFVFRGVYMLKTYGESRTMMSSQGNLKGALICLLVGTVLLFSQTIYDSLLLSTFNTTSTSPLQYEHSIKMSADAYFALLRFIQLIGIISFIRGWVMLTHLGNAGQQNTFGKSLTHIIGGLLAINIQGTVNILKGTIGM